MALTLQQFVHSRTRKDLPEIKPGYVVKVYQRIIETKEIGKKKEAKERIQVFEGLVIGRKSGKGINATITVRKLSGGVGVERIFPLSTPTIEKIELVKTTKARRAKLNYMRDRIGKATQPKGELVKKEEDEQKIEKGAPAEVGKEKKAEASIEAKKEMESEAEEAKKEITAKTEKKEEIKK